MEKHWVLLTDELDSQPSPPSPDPTDFGHSCNPPQIRTLSLSPTIPLPPLTLSCLINYASQVFPPPMKFEFLTNTQKGESTQPTPPSLIVVQNLNCDLQDTLFISQDKDASTDVIPATKFKNRLSRSRKKGG